MRSNRENTNAAAPPNRLLLLRNRFFQRRWRPMRVPDSPSLSNTVVEEDEVGDNEENSSCMPRQEDMLIGSGGSSRIEVERATTSPSGIAPASLLPAQISLVDNHEDGCVAVVVDVTQEAFFRRLTSTNSSVPRIIDVVALPSPPPATSNWNVCSSVEKVVEEEKYTPPELSSPRQIGDSCGMFDSALIGASTDNHHYRMSPGTKLHTAKKYTMMKQSMASISLPYSTASTGAAVDDDWEDQNASDESRNNIDPSRLTSRSIIFPTHFARSSRAQRETTAFHKQCKISAALDKCNTYCGKSSMKLCLEQMNLHAEDVPLEEMMGSSPHVSLYKALILANNPLGMIPLKLVHCLPSLKTLDLTNCRLKELPSSWDLPKLIELKLCRNQLCEFPENSILSGLPSLKSLDLYENKISIITLPSEPLLLIGLEYMDIGYNDIITLPSDLHLLRSLRTLKACNNLLTSIPMVVCTMKTIRCIESSCNPLVEPPQEICEKGIHAMQKYWHRRLSTNVGKSADQNFIKQRIGDR